MEEGTGINLREHYKNFFYHVKHDYTLKYTESKSSVLLDDVYLVFGFSFYSYSYKIKTGVLTMLLTLICDNFITAAMPMMTRTTRTSDRYSGPPRCWPVR